MTEALFLVLVTYFVHSTIFLAGAWAIERSGITRSSAARELLWRCALFAGIATATAQTAWPAVASMLRDARAPVATTVVHHAPGASEAAMPALPHGAQGERNLPRSYAFAQPATAAGVVATRGATWALPAATRAVADSLVVLWLLAGFLGAVAIVVSIRRRAAELARLRPCAHAVAEAFVRRVCVSNDLRAPRIVEDPASTSPTANLGGVLTLPPWALRGIEGESLEAMLAHELGHIARRDLAWRVAARLVHSLFWFQPLNGLAARRLDALAELGADAWAVGATGDRRALAHCLARCATELGRARPVQFAIAMTGGSPLLHRIQNLLQENPMQSTTVRPVHRWLIAIALLLAIVVLPVFVIAPAVAGHGSQIEISTGRFGGGYTKVNIDEDGLKLSAEIRGSVHFNETETDVVGLGAGDEAFIEEVQAGVERRIEFTEKGNTIIRRYFVDGRMQPIDTAGRAWLQTVVPTLLREAGIDADARAKRIHARGGAGAVLSEIAIIRSGYVRKVYLSRLARLGTMRPVELDRAVKLAAAIDSDFERRESLVALIENQQFAEPQQVALLGAVATISSDFEKRSVLDALVPKLRSDDNVGMAWARAVATIDSSFEHREVLVALAERRQLAPTVTRLALRSVDGIDSDFEKRSALEAFVRHVAGKPNLTADYVKSARGIDSDYERRVALLSVMRQGPIDAGTARAVLDAAADIGSDYEKSEVLAGVAARMPNDAPLIARYRDIARDMGDHERGQAEKALDRFAG